jgi:hypothetical protein
MRNSQFNTLRLDITKKKNGIVKRLLLLNRNKSEII